MMQCEYKVSDRAETSLVTACTRGMWWLPHCIHAWPRIGSDIEVQSVRVMLKVQLNPTNPIRVRATLRVRVWVRCFVVTREDEGVLCVRRQRCGRRYRSGIWDVAGREAVQHANSVRVWVWVWFRVRDRIQVWVIHIQGPDLEPVLDPNPNQYCNYKSNRSPHPALTLTLTLTLSTTLNRSTKFAKVQVAKQISGCRGMPRECLGKL